MVNTCFEFRHYRDLVVETGEEAVDSTVGIQLNLRLLLSGERRRMSLVARNRRCCFLSGDLRCLLENGLGWRSLSDLLLVGFCFKFGVELRFEIVLENFHGVIVVSGCEFKVELSFKIFIEEVHGVVVVSGPEFRVKLSFKVSIEDIHGYVTVCCSEFSVKLCLEVLLEEICGSVALDLSIEGLSGHIWNLLAELGKELLVGHVLTVAVVGSRSTVAETGTMRRGVTNCFALICGVVSTAKGLLHPVLFDIDVVFDYERAGAALARLRTVSIAEGTAKTITARVDGRSDRGGGVGVTWRVRDVWG